MEKRIEYNVVSCDQKRPGIMTVLLVWVDEATARDYLRKYRLRYGEYPNGKPYPNGLGVYEFNFLLAWRYAGETEFVTQTD